MKDAIKQRYTFEAAACSNLSCGSNLELAALCPGEWVLDLGCGRGTDVLRAVELVSPGGRVIGLDLTPAMLEQARTAAREQGKADKCDFVQGDLTCLPFAADSFDCVLSNCVINHVEDKALAYREIARVLRPGGRMVISDAVSLVPLPEAVRQDPEARAQCWGGAVTEEEYLATIKAAGFQSITILKRREYQKNGYPFASITLQAVKGREGR